jgi:restriction system protein
MLGKKSTHAQECLKGGFIGADYKVVQDLSHRLPDNWRDFNKEFIPIFLSNHPDKGRITAGLACGALWTVCKGIQKGDVVLCPNGSGSYLVGEVTGDYCYKAGEVLPHRRPVSWSQRTIERSAMSEALRNSTGSVGTVSTISKFAEEIEKLIDGYSAPTLLSTDETVEDPSVFALEEHLEEFLLKNWSHTDLGRKFDIFQEDGELVGQQYETDTGPIDILAISKDKTELLVVELKKGRASDSVVGQIQRYMGYVLEELAEENQKVRGVIIALEDDIRIRRALKVAANIEFFRYEVSFRLFKA